MLRDAKSVRAKLASRSSQQTHMLDEMPEGLKSLMLGGSSGTCSRGTERFF